MKRTITIEKDQDLKSRRTIVLDTEEYESIPFEASQYEMTKGKDKELLEPLPISSQPQHALSILQNHGFKPKVFCLANPEYQGSNFEVLSDKWNWTVTPIKTNGIHEIPPRFLQGIKILMENNVPVQSVAIAKPSSKEGVTEVVRQEVSRTMQTGLGIARCGVSLLAAGMNIGAAPSGFVSGITAIDLLDPVLLARVGNSWIEIGRWE